MSEKFDKEKMKAKREKEMEDSVNLWSSLISDEAEKTPENERAGDWAGFRYGAGQRRR